MQKTITENGQKLKIVVRRCSYCRNPCGFNVFINEKKFFVNVLTSKEAVDRALERFNSESL